MPLFGVGFSPKSHVFLVLLDQLIHRVPQVSPFLGLVSSGIKWQFVMGTAEGTIITLTALKVKAWGWGSFERREGNLSLIHLGDCFAFKTQADVWNASHV